MALRKGTLFPQFSFYTPLTPVAKYTWPGNSQKGQRNVQQSGMGKCKILVIYCFKLFVPCIFSTYGMKTNWCHYFIRILLCSRAREQSGTETEPMVVWTAVWTLLKMGLWAWNV